MLQGEAICWPSFWILLLCSLFSGLCAFASSAHAIILTSPSSLPFCVSAVRLCGDPCPAVHESTPYASCNIPFPTSFGQPHLFLGVLCRVLRSS
eukprot:m.53089 g.53089  ORF g.53089 m.53089 type:complete len:94 (-) comp6733_c1_seq1:1856-2137(-)